MKITVITLFPGMITGFLNESIVKRAQEKGAVAVNIVNLRDFALDSYGTVDDRPYGGGAGMVMRVDVMAKAVRSVGAGKVLHTSPKGKTLTQEMISAYAKEKHLIIIASHYEGLDERASEFINEEVSLGDFVMTGGELTAAAIVDSVVRLLPGVLKKEDAIVYESFQEVNVAELSQVVSGDEVLDRLVKSGVKTVKLLEYPHYTRPPEFEQKTVPEVLVSGDPKKIREWQLMESWKITKAKRPDLLEHKS